MSRALRIMALFALTSLSVASFAAPAPDVMPSDEESQGIAQQYDENTLDETSPEVEGAWRYWVCFVQNRRGERFRGQGFSRYEARERALRHCYNRSRRCHFVACPLR
jgi:hypothetical protein